MILLSDIFNNLILKYILISVCCPSPNSNIYEMKIRKSVGTVWQNLIEGKFSGNFRKEKEK